MIDEHTRLLVQLGLASGGQLVWDPGAPSGQLTQQLVSLMGRTFRCQFAAPMSRLMIPDDTAFVVWTDSKPELVRLQAGDRIMRSHIVATPAFLQTAYRVHGGILPDNKRLVVGTNEDESCVLFGCF